MDNFWFKKIKIYKIYERFQSLDLRKLQKVPKQLTT